MLMHTSILYKSLNSNKLGLRYLSLCEKQVLRFATALSRPPAGGFASLPRRFRLRRDPRPVPRLPSARTCFSELLLPDYATATDLSHALHAAIDEGGRGPFGLA